MWRRKSDKIEERRAKRERESGALLPIMKASIYLRVSSEEQNETNQLAACEQFCQARSWEIVHVYRDHGLSGYQDTERPDYEACKSDARAGKFKHIVVWALDRWTRQGSQALMRDLNDLSLWGVQLHSVQEDFLDSFNVEGELGAILRRFISEVLAWQARLEAIKLSDRVKAAYNRKREAGELADWGRPAIELDHAAVKAKYDELRSLRKTAKHFGCSYQTVRRLLQNGHYPDKPESPTGSSAPSPL
ncbi:recombinase family protein [Candidatus Acetothermia bacterium]|nr:recombinase family protein [Candidatus Acetothermia bacterium]